MQTDPCLESPRAHKRVQMLFWHLELPAKCPASSRRSHPSQSTKQADTSNTHVLHTHAHTHTHACVIDIHTSTFIYGNIQVQDMDSCQQTASNKHWVYMCERKMRTHIWHFPPQVKQAPQRFRTHKEMFTPWPRKTWKQYIFQTCGYTWVKTQTKLHYGSVLKTYTPQFICTYSLNPFSIFSCSAWLSSLPFWVKTILATLTEENDSAICLWLLLNRNSMLTGNI